MYDSGYKFYWIELIIIFIFLYDKKYKKMIYHEVMDFIGAT
jgi:hypothetical protein